MNMFARRIALLGKPRERYLLCDEFLDARAAGAVNGTLATPGPGTRTVVDTGNKISIGNGYMTIVSSGSEVDPRYVLDAVSRVAGRMLVRKARVSNVNAYLYPAFHVNPGSAIGSIGPLFGVGFINTQSGAAVIGSVTSTDYYLLCTVLRSVGAYMFVKGNNYPEWTLLWVQTTGSDATLYPRVANYIYTGYVDFIRVPAATWLPTPLAYDTFTRANGALGSTEATGPDGQSSPALAWTNQQGTVQISSNAAKATALDGSGRAICTVPTASADVLLSAAFTKGTTGAGIVLRYQDSNNYVYIWHNGTNLQMIKREAGVETTLVNAAASYAAGRVMVGIISGTSCSSYYHNAKIGATQTVPSSSYTPHGLIFFDTDSTLDLFTCLARGTGGDYTALDRWSGVNP